MNKQEILNEIEKTKEHLANMEKMLEERNGKEWEPRHLEPYYYVNSCGQAQFTVNNGIAFDHLIIKAKNVFKTKEEAKRESEKILVRRQLEDIAKRLNKGRGFDWSDENQYKWFIIYNNTFGVASYSVSENRTLGTIYCLDRNFKDVAIKEIGEERLKKYLRGE